MTSDFKGNFTQQLPMPEAAIDAAVKVLRHGRLHRYNVVGDEQSETNLLESEFAAYTGAKYCLACASGGYALATALRAIGVRQGDKVLTNAFTLAPVPGAIANAGGEAVFVEVKPDLTIDLDDLSRKIAASGAKVLLLSHMRGHIVDMDRLVALCQEHRVKIVEDCAHTMGAKWAGVESGRHGAVACYSTQTYKHLNSGEGGLLTTDDAELMARATMLSGSYMLYGQHAAGPEPAVFDEIRFETPNCSGRMDNLRAAILRVQLADLDQAVSDWNERYQTIETALRPIEGVRIIPRPQEEFYVGSSIQFSLTKFSADKIIQFVGNCATRGVSLKWFGAEEPAGYTSRYDSWRYVPPQKLPQTDAVLASLVDMRIPLTFSLADCQQIGEIIKEEATALLTPNG